MLVWSIAVLSAAVVAAADRQRVARGAGGLALVALGVASLHLGAGTVEVEQLSRLAMTAALRPWFLETNLALIGLGVLLAVAGTRSRIAAAGGALVVASLWPIGGTISMLRTVTVLVGVGMGLAGMSLAIRLARQRLPSSKPAPRFADLPGRRSTVIAVIGLLALASPWAPGTLGAVAVAFGLGARYSPARLERLVLGLAGFMALAGLVVWATAGSPASPEAPSGALLSGRQSVLLAGLLLLPSAVGLVAWPARRMAPGWALLPAAIAVIGRIGPESVPLGLAWWLPVVFPVGIAGVMRGLVVGEWTRAAGSLAWVGLWIGTSGSRVGALLLGITVLGVTFHPMMRAPLEPWWFRILWATAGVGAVLVLSGGLAAQVVYSTLLALVVAAALISRRVAGPEAST